MNEKDHKQTENEIVMRTNGTEGGVTQGEVEDRNDRGREEKHTE